VDGIDWSRRDEPGSIDARSRAQSAVTHLCENVSSGRRVDEETLIETIVLALGVAVEIRDGNTQGHCQRLARHAASVGRRLGLSADDCETLNRGGYLHDLGKIAIPDCILLKPGSLTWAETSFMQLHTVFGDVLCQRFPVLRRVRPIVRSHHERLDGTGYPDRLKGDRVPLLAQIIGIVDVYDAIVSARPYKPAQSPAVAYEVLMDEVKRGWRRRDLVDEFIETLIAEHMAA
jgi:putative two-component system response regulator